MKERWRWLLQGLALGCADVGGRAHELDAAKLDAGESDSAPLDGGARGWLDAELADGATDAQPALAFQTREVLLGPDGRSERLGFALTQWDRPVLALRSYAPEASGALCFQLEDVQANGTTEWIPAATSADYGDYCTRCAQRVAVGYGYGLFILPSAEAALASLREITLRIALRDCLTLAPLAVGAPRPRSLVVENVSFAEPSPEERVELPLLFVEATPYTFTGGARLADVFARVQEIWRVAGIELVLRGPLSLPRASAPLVYGATDRSRLSRLDQAAKQLAQQAGIEASAARVVFTPCLVREDTLREGSAQPLAMTAHLPGGFAVRGEADGIFVAGERCGGLEPFASYLESQTLAAIVAHELGHYLGLFHVRESDGRADVLADTNDETPNLMQAQVSVSATALTDTQVRVARRHLALAVAKHE